MRKQNSEFLTAFTSEASNDIKNTDFFGFVELDDYACYVIADGIDDQLEAKSAKLATDAVVSTFSEAPSISKGTLKRCMRAANNALLEAKSKMKMKASIIIVLTNYEQLRYGQAGNIRLRLYRNGFIKEQTVDQSLTMDMVKEEKVTQDKVAMHEQRNNLYTYLGQEREFQPYISKKIKLTNADAIALYTLGVWEHVDEGELKDAFADATDDPKETVESIEDLLLSRQPKELKKYTLAVIFVNKIFVDPNRKRRIKKYITMVVVVVVLIVVVTILTIILRRRRQEKIAKLQDTYTNTIEYIQMNNYTRAEECCEEAKDLADDLKDRKMQKELSNFQKLIEAVLTAEERLDKEQYTEAQAAYQDALKRARYVDNLGKDYIDERLALTAAYISVYDAIYLGDSLLLNLQYDKAEEKYLEAKAQAAEIYFDEGRTSAIEALNNLYEAQKDEVEADNEKIKEQKAQEESAANYILQGDMAFAKGDYEGAKVYYTSAVQKYEEMKDETQKEDAEEKLLAVETKLAKKESLESEASCYMTKAKNALDAGDYAKAKKYYLLAKDIYASLNDEDKIDEITRKMEAVDIEESSQQNIEPSTSPSAEPSEQPIQQPSTQPSENPTPTVEEETTEK